MQIKQATLAIVAALTMAFAVPAFADVKIAVVDVQNAILNSDQAKRLLAQIKSEFKGQEDQIRKIQSDAAALLQRAQKDSDVMSDAEKRKLQAQIDSKNNDFVYLRKKLQKQIQDRQTELFTGVDQEVQKAIEDLVRSEDYDLIIPRQAALYVGDVYNITRKVTEKLNEYDAAAQAAKSKTKK